MSRIPQIDPAGETATHMATARKMFGGAIPNLFATAAQSSAAA